jgi:hypothetical protein
MKKHRIHVETKQELLKLNYTRTKCFKLIIKKLKIKWNKKPIRFARNKTIVCLKITTRKKSQIMPKKMKCEIKNKWCDVRTLCWKMLWSWNTWRCCNVLKLKWAWKKNLKSRTSSPNAHEKKIEDNECLQMISEKCLKQRDL